MLSLLIGNILLIGIVAGTPIYVQATMQRILIQDMEHVQLERNVHPMIMELGFSFNSVAEEASLSTYETISEEGVPLIIDILGIPVQRIVHNLIMTDVTVTPAEQRAETPRFQSISLNTFAGFEDHINLTHGRLPSGDLQEGNIIEGVVNQRTMSQRGFFIGEILAIRNINYSGEDREIGDPHDYYLKIVGVYEGTEDQGLFWTTNPNYFSRQVFVSHDLMANHFVANYQAQYNISSHWDVLLDFYSISTFDVLDYLAADSRIRSEITLVREEVITYRENFISTLEGYVDRTDRLNTTLLVLQIPIYVFLAFYIFIISRQILHLEQNDISILKSRGTSRRQIILIYLTQSIFVSMVSVAIGIPLGVLVCRFLGASSGFLELVSRVAIETPINRYVFIYSGIAAVASVLMMLIPVIGFSKIAIVEHKRSKSRVEKKPIWQRYFLDILFLGISVYGYYNFMSRREIMALAVVEVQAMDPLLFISSSLFIIGLGLFCLRIYPYLIKLISILGNRFWSPAFYASLLKVVRFSSNEQFIMVFLVFTLSLGIFSATTARTLNTNTENLLQYQAGADLVFAEVFQDNIPAPDMYGNINMPDRIIYTEPDFERFTGFDEVDSLTRVMVSDVVINRNRRNFDNVTMMAIDTNTFGETIWYRNDLLPVHINFFLNALALNEDGIILTDNFRTRYSFELGERIVYFDDYGNRTSGVVIGFVERWPTFSDRIRVEHRGEYVFEDAFMMITNLGHIHAMWGIYPYQVWMSTNTPSNRFFYDFVREYNLDLLYFEDTNASVVASKNDPILQGTNGILTAGFIFTFLACFTGFLIYWTLSIKSRTLQFGVFNAMGMTKRELIRLLIYEQVFVSFSAILIGFVVGEIGARLFVPLIQIAYSPALQMIPLMIVIEDSDYRNIFMVIGLMFLICLFILGSLISKLKIASALKLGED